MIRFVVILFNMISKRVSILFFCFLYKTINSQVVEVLRKSADTSPIPAVRFDYIEPATDTLNLKFKATIKVSGKGTNSEIETLYNTIFVMANQLGANSYRFNKYVVDDNLNSACLILDTYFGTDSVLKLNSLNHEKNVLYVFGSEPKTDKVISFRIDGVKHKVEPGTYYRYQNKEGHEAEINKGGITGESIWVKWAVNKMPLFLTLKGFEFNQKGYAATIPQSYTMVYVSFNTGRINYVGWDFGYLLLLIYKKID